MNTALICAVSLIFSEESLRGDHESTAVGIRGARRIDRANLLEATPFEFGVVDISVLRSAYSRASKSRGTAYGSGPRAVTSICSDELNGVACFDLNDLTPTDQMSANGVCDNHVIGVELNFGSEEYQIAPTENCEGDKNADYFSSKTFISKGVVSEKQRPGNTDSTQEPGISRSESYLLHSEILSHEQLLQDGFAS